MEANAMEVVLLMIEDGSVELRSSEVVEYENRQSPYAERRTFIEPVLRQATACQEITDGVNVRARQIAASGAKRVTHCTLPAPKRLWPTCS